jgi:MoaD family protein
MQIEVLYFGRLREISGQRQEKLDMPQGGTVSRIFHALTAKYGDGFKERIEDPDRYSILINGRHYMTMAGDRSKLKNGDQVVFMPVTMGG